MSWGGSWPIVEPVYGRRRSEFRTSGGDAFAGYVGKR